MIKSIQLHFHGKFNDQYTLDWKDNLKANEFESILGLLNQAVYLSQLSISIKLTLFVSALVSWLTVVTAVFMLWAHFDNPVVLVAIPLLLALNLIALYLLQLQRRKLFERNILRVCDQLNATENIRGVYFTFLKNGYRVAFPPKNPSLSCKPVSYAVDIRFDDRYSALRNSVLKEYYPRIPKPEAALLDRKYIKKDFQQKVLPTSKVSPINV